MSLFETLFSNFKKFFTPEQKANSLVELRNSENITKTRTRLIQ